MSAGLSHSNSASGLTVTESGPDTETIVVFIHGSLDRAAGMARLTRLAQASHRTVRYDRRGYGIHCDHDGPFTVSANADDVIAMMAGRRSVLVGHSFGGNIALSVAARVPHLVAGVSTYETPLSWFDWWPTDSAGGTALSADPEDAAETFLVRMIGRERWEQVPERTKAQRRREGRALRDELTDLRSAQPWNATDISAPVLCGRGTRAHEHHLVAAARLSEMLPDARLVTIDGAGHGAPVSHPHEFHSLLVAPHLEGSGTFRSMS